MPFTPYKQSLDPVTLHAAYEAFELGWAELQKRDGYDLQVARDLLAKRIVQAALENGECDPNRLKDLALEGFSL